MQFVEDNHKDHLIFQSWLKLTDKVREQLDCGNIGIDEAKQRCDHMFKEYQNVDRKIMDLNKVEKFYMAFARGK